MFLRDIEHLSCWADHKAPKYHAETEEKNRSAKAGPTNTVKIWTKKSAHPFCLTLIPGLLPYPQLQVPSSPNEPLEFRFSSPGSQPATQPATQHCEHSIPPTPAAPEPRGTHRQTHTKEHMIRMINECSWSRDLNPKGLSLRETGA